MSYRPRRLYSIEQAFACSNRRSEHSRPSSKLKQSLRKCLLEGKKERGGDGYNCTPIMLKIRFFLINCSPLHTITTLIDPFHHCVPRTDTSGQFWTERKHITIKKQQVTISLSYASLRVAHASNAEYTDSEDSRDSAVLFGLLLAMYDRITDQISSSLTRIRIRIDKTFKNTMQLLTYHIIMTTYLILGYCVFHKDTEVEIEGRPRLPRSEVS